MNAEKARIWATEKHEGQTRRNGDPYITHPEAVADIIRRVKSSHKIDDLIAAAYGHDTIEDTDATYEELIQLFGPTVTSLIYEMTSDEEELKRLGKTEYLKRKFAGMSSWGLVLKLSDRLHNVSDLNQTDEKWATKYAAQTKEIIDYLTSNRKLSKPQVQLVEEIKESLTAFFANH